MGGNKINSILRFDNYIVDRAVFKNNPKFEGDEIDIQFDIEPQFQISEEKDSMIVVLEVDIFKDAIQNNYPFEMSIALVGMFQLEGMDDNIEKFKMNAVAILYPYVRSLVTSFTANSNITPLILPTINVNKLIKEKINSEL